MVIKPALNGSSIEGRAGPVFLTREQREKMAKEEREAEEKEKREALEREQKLLKESRQREAQKAAESETVTSSQQRKRNLSSSGKQENPKGVKTNESDPQLVLEDAELAYIRERYMGKQKQKKIRKLGERKFLFDWDENDDTSIDINPIFNEKREISMFGKGNLGGFDNEIQEKRHKFYQEKKVSIANSSSSSSTGNVNEKQKWLDRHWSEKPLDQMRDRDWRIFKEDFNISTRGGSIPHPIRFWSEASVPDSIKQVIEHVGYKEPTPIQRQSIPIALQNRDLIGIAETGSGKTAAFLIPMLTFISRLPKISEENQHLGPYALILAPTRELAQQIEVECKKFAKPMNFTCVSFIGGRMMEEQAFSMRNGAEIVIGTPGRLKQCLEEHTFVLSQCFYVVMDEADRMIDMGFEEDVNFILDEIPASNLKPLSIEDEDFEKIETEKYRQTIMFSATMPSAVERLASKYLRKPAMVLIGEKGKAVDTVEQKVEMILEENKKRRLLSILTSNEYEPPIIVFVNQKKTADLLSKILEKEGFRATCLHGGKNQEQRELALNALKKAHKEILVATDVASRGIDIKDVSLVINYDMAKNIEDYTHRIGRTGRAGKSGTAITFLTANDTDLYYDLKQILINSSISSCPPELLRHEAAKYKPGTFAPLSRSEEK